MLLYLVLAAYRFCEEEMEREREEKRKEGLSDGLDKHVLLCHYSSTQTSWTILPQLPIFRTTTG